MIYLMRKLVSILILASYHLLFSKQINDTSTLSPTDIYQEELSTSISIPKPLIKSMETKEFLPLILDSLSLISNGDTLLKFSKLEKNDNKSRILNQIFTSSSANEESNIAKVAISLSQKSGKNIGFLIKTLDSTALGAGKDYSSLNETLTIPKGREGTTFDIPIKNDIIDENDEVFFINIIDTSTRNASLGIRRTHRLTIIDDDPPPFVDFLLTSSTISESVLSHPIILTLDTESGKPVSVNFKINSNSTATLNEDYKCLTYTALFPIGIVRDTIFLDIINDLTDEDHQLIYLTLENPLNSRIGSKNNHKIRINDDDAPPFITFEKEFQSQLENETEASIPLLLSTKSEKEITVYYTISNYGTTAKKIFDYNFEYNKLKLSPNSSGLFQIEFSINNDRLDEKDEVVIINLLPNPINANVGVFGRHTFTIIDDDSEPIVQFSKDDHGNDKYSATELNFSLLTEGIIEEPKDVDFFKFDLKKPITVLIRSWGNTNVRASLYNNVGKLIANNSNGSNINNFQITTPLLPGLHLVKVTHSSNNGTGAYSIQLETAEQYEKQADELIINKTKAYFTLGHVVYIYENSMNQSLANRIRIKSVDMSMDKKRYISIILNDSLIINPSFCYVPSEGKYENLAIIQRNYISNKNETDGLPRFLPQNMLENSIVFGTVRDYRTRKPLSGVEIRLFSQIKVSDVSATTLINLSDGDSWERGKTMSTRKNKYNFPLINHNPKEIGRRITDENGKFAISVSDTGLIKIEALPRLNIHRKKEKEVRLKEKRGEYYSVNLWMLPK